MAGGAAACEDDEARRFESPTDPRREALGWGLDFDAPAWAQPDPFAAEREELAAMHEELAAMHGGSENDAGASATGRQWRRASNEMRLAEHGECVYCDYHDLNGASRRIFIALCNPAPRDPVSVLFERRCGCGGGGGSSASSMRAARAAAGVARWG